MPRYSVIVPVYNAEKTLRRCVDSLLNQNYRDMELILVNDGSPDGSGAICQEYADRYPCVLYIDKPNGGVSSARNAGLDIAKGKFVLFVDSDDYVSDNYFEALDNICTAQDYEYVLFSFTEVKGEKQIPKKYQSFSADNQKESVPKFCEALYTKALNGPCNKRYVRRILEENQIRFPEHLSIGEDKSFNLRYALCCTSCFISSELLYYVSLDNQDSLSRKIRHDWQEQFALLDIETQNTIRNAKISDVYRQEFFAAENLIQLRAAYSESKRMHLAKRKCRERRAEIKKILNRINSTERKFPGGIFSKLLQIPVRLRMITLIDFAGWYLSR